jgi:hypothetical protein
MHTLTEQEETRLAVPKALSLHTCDSQSFISLDPWFPKFYHFRPVAPKALSLQTCGF